MHETEHNDSYDEFDGCSVDMLVKFPFIYVTKRMSKNVAVCRFCPTDFCFMMRSVVTVTSSGIPHARNRNPSRIIDSNVV